MVIILKSTAYSRQFTLNHAFFTFKIFQIDGICYHMDFELLFMHVEKIKIEKFVCEVGKSVILCQFITN